MTRFIFYFIFYIIPVISFSQVVTKTPLPDTSNIRRPKLIVGLVIDQMRWDFLYRYYDRYLNDGGFKRLLNGGFSCENTFINYTPSVTACGHTAVYTGSVPSLTGITGNEWWDYQKGDFFYCTEDDSVKTVGSITDKGKMSPRNLLVNTMGDELKLATNFRSKVIGLALKDRGAILSAGHSADAAYWYDEKTGDWISSSYYIDELPQWVKAINSRKLVDSSYQYNWRTMYPLETYTQSSTDKKTFDYDLKPYIGKNYRFLYVTPYGNTLTLEMAKAAINNEKLGMDAYPDLLAISFSTPDYTGHTFGPNSVETEDVFLRLDKELGDFIDYLDEKVGKGQYLVFLTADHGVSQVPSFLKKHKVPAGNVDVETIYQQLNALLAEKFKTPDLCLGIFNYQVYLNRDSIDIKRINLDSVEQTVIPFLLKQPGIKDAFSQKKLSELTLPAKIKKTFINGFHSNRSGDIQIIFEPQWIEGLLQGGTTHGLFNPYDTHIPLLWYGWGIKHGKTYREVNVTDITPTLSSLLNIQVPNGSIGAVISEIVK
ncbi:MAG TPA: alkaline phosphatase PafA [Chitinophagaceae bacterium]|nr:alkaline phosphatase PafA [Chitinophagaceae bacterium]